MLMEAQSAQQEEKTAQDLFAAGYPGHGFHLHRMHQEEEGRQQGGFRGCEKPKKQEVDQEGVQGV
jgi:hypothetical protein